MSEQLRLEQYDTVLYNSNLNPMGIPESVKKALSDNIESIVKYPDIYYDNLKKAIATYAKCNEDCIVLGNGSSDMLRMFTAIIGPKKALLLKPSATEYENVLTIFGCEIDFFELDEEKDFELDVHELVSSLDSSYDMIVIGNPNNPTSQIISRDDIETLAEVCKRLDIFLVVDEMYIEFVEKYENITAISLTDEYDNLVVMRSISKFFAVPGLRLSYSIMNNPDYSAVLEITTTPNSVSTLTAAACCEMFKDSSYIMASRSQIKTERNLIYSAMSTSKKIKLYKPYANFMLVKILEDHVFANDVEERCKVKGIIIRNCENIRGLSNKYIRFCFMKPEQNDLLVNTILESLN